MFSSPVLVVITNCSQTKSFCCPSLINQTPGASRDNLLAFQSIYSRRRQCTTTRTNYIIEEELAPPPPPPLLFLERASSYCKRQQGRVTAHHPLESYHLHSQQRIVSTGLYWRQLVFEKSRNDWPTLKLFQYRMHGNERAIRQTFWNIRMDLLHRHPMMVANCSRTSSKYL